MNRRASREEIRETYDRIAGHFSRTRSAPWPEVREFVNGHEGCSRAIDIGCGNGRHLPILATVATEVIGLDISSNALEEARKNCTPEITLVQADAVDLPIRGRTVDLALYIATLHHLPDRRGRVASLDELDRILAPGGRGLVSVWSVHDERFDFAEARDHRIPWTLPDGTTIDRYYHIYDRDEFVEELGRSSLKVVDLERSSGNWYGTVEPS